jgi:hypothetical protein
MTTNEVLRALDALAVETGSLACLGCGREHNCGAHGCAIIRAAGLTIRELIAEKGQLKRRIRFLYEMSVPGTLPEEPEKRDDP